MFLDIIDLYAESLYFKGVNIYENPLRIVEID